MSVINFKCSSEQKNDVKKKCWEAIHKHYSNSVFPNSNIKYENEGKDVYSARLDELMKTELCKIEDTEDGVRFEFDSTEDAGFSIASAVYHTNMGYNDNGLTFLKTLFDDIVQALPEIPFEAHCECDDEWVSEEYSCSYDGATFTSDAEWFDYEN